MLLLRPGFFFENFYEALEMILHKGVNANSVEPDRAMPMVGTRDIADMAAKALLARDWTGIVVRELLGPRDLTYAEATRILGEQIGKPELKYVQIPYGDQKKALVQAGVSENFADLYVQMIRGFNEGKFKPGSRTPDNTTPTRLEDFARDFARVYEERTRKVA